MLFIYFDKINNFLAQVLGLTEVEKRHARFFTNKVVVMDVEKILLDYTKMKMIMEKHIIIEGM